MVALAVLVSLGVVGRLYLSSGAAAQDIRQEPPLTVGQTISVVGDMGTGGKGQYAVAASIKASGPILVKTVGDNIYDYPTDKNFKSNFHNVYAPLNIPFEITLGNHDWYNGDPIKFWRLASEKYSWIKWHGNYYATQRGRICEMHLDTELFDNQGLRTVGKLKPIKVRDEQEEWIKATLPKLKAVCSIIIGYGHHPYLSSGKGHGDAQGHWEGIFRKHLLGKLDIYIAGHEHILSDEGAHGGTRLLISGSGGKIEEGLVRAPAKWGADELGHLDITLLTPDTLEFRFVTVVGNTRVVAHRFTMSF